MVGAFGPKMLRLTAQYADWWDVSSTGITAYRRMAAEFERACTEIGRDPATDEAIVVRWVRLRSYSGRSARLSPVTSTTPNNDEDFDFVGTPGQLIEQMRPFIAEGVDYFILDCGGFPRLTTLELLVNQVLPALNNH